MTLEQFAVKVNAMDLYGVQSLIDIIGYQDTPHPEQESRLKLLRDRARLLELAEARERAIAAIREYRQLLIPGTEPVALEQILCEAAE